MRIHYMPDEGALVACRSVRSILVGSLLEDIERLVRQGEVLADPVQWDSECAEQFRRDWPAMRDALTSAHEAACTLRSQIDDITRAVMGMRAQR